MTERAGPTWRDFLDLRGVREGDECKCCRGLGTRTYGSTATWRGGPGGQMVTQDVCNKCWGSGSRSRQWVDLRRVDSMRREIEALWSRLEPKEAEQ